MASLKSSNCSSFSVTEVTVELKPHKNKNLCPTSDTAGQAVQRKQRLGCDNAAWDGGGERELRHTMNRSLETECVVS